MVPRRPRMGTTQRIAGRDNAVSNAFGFADGPALEARFRWPHGVVKLRDGSVIIADDRNHRLRKLRGGEITTFAGGDLQGFSDGPTGSSRLRGPTGMSLDAHGRDLFLADEGNHRIRRVSPDGETTTEPMLLAVMPTPSVPL